MIVELRAPDFMNAGERVRMELNHCTETVSADNRITAILHVQDLARELRGLLALEADTLKRFESRELMGIIHRKESLIGELAEELRELSEADGGQPNMRDDPRFNTLRKYLREIEEINRSNRFFIEGTLSHFQDFMDHLLPPTYPPRHLNQGKRGLAAFKGLTLRKEI